MPYQPPPDDVSIPHIPVSAEFYHVHFPKLFILESNPLSSEMKKNKPNLAAKPLEHVSIENNPFNKLILHQAFYGFTFQSAPVIMGMLLANKQLIDKEVRAKHGIQVPAQKQLQKEKSALHYDAAVLLRSVVCVNFQIISNLINAQSTWGFFLAFEPSPYYGAGGLEVRLRFLSSACKEESYHLLGLGKPHVDIPNLEGLLSVLCPEYKQKLLGIIVELDNDQHHSAMGVMASRAIAYLMHQCPIPDMFLTPDMRKTTPAPSMFPCELAKCSMEDMEKLIAKYECVLSKSWTPEMIQLIRDEHKEFCSEMASRILEEPRERNMKCFEKTWEIVGEKYANLRLFIGVFALAYLSKLEKRVRVSLTSLERAAENESDMFVAAEVILQARQFLELREHLG